MADENYIKELLFERSGHERRLKTAEDAEDAEAATEAKGNIAVINAELKRRGHGAKPPAKRAETRPAKARTTRKKA